MNILWLAFSQAIATRNWWRSRYLEYSLGIIQTHKISPFPKRKGFYTPEKTKIFSFHQQKFIFYVRYCCTDRLKEEVRFD